MDYLTFEGAKELALAIKNYWWNKGYLITTEVVASATKDRGMDRHLFSVRSNLFNGLPQR